MRMNALSGWFAVLIITLAIGLSIELLFGVAYPAAHISAMLLIKLAVPGLFLSHLAGEFYPPQNARAIQILVNAGVAALISIVVVASLVPSVGIPFVNTLRIWGYVALQLGITVGTVMLGSTMAMNYLRVPSGRLRGITLFVMIALATSIIWIPWDVAAGAALLLVTVRATAK